MWSRKEWQVVTVQWNSLSATFSCVGNLPAEIRLRFHGSLGTTTERVFNDSFASFKRRARAVRSLRQPASRGDNANRAGERCIHSGARRCLPCPLSPPYWITGATGKLGRSFALGFAGLGYDIVIPARRADAAEALRNECLAAGAGRVIRDSVDLSAPDGAVARRRAVGDE